MIRGNLDVENFKASMKYRNQKTNIIFRSFLILQLSCQVLVACANEHSIDNNLDSYKKEEADTQSHSIQLLNTTLKLNFRHTPQHREWAVKNISRIATGIQFLEKYVGFPYPGKNPYPISERYLIGEMGRAGPSGMYIAPPPTGSTWTMMHEIVHIWNAGNAPAFISEGLANFLSYILMIQNDFPFDPQETYAHWVQRWRSQLRKGEDQPLFDSGKDKYHEVRQGKAMEFWAIAYEVYGPEFIKTVFRTCVQKVKCETNDLSHILAQFGNKKPETLLSGWITKGPYLVRSSKNLGKVRFPIPEVFPKLTTRVFAEWQPGRWYRGHIGLTCADNKTPIVYDDGEQKCHVEAEVVVDKPPGRNELREESRVLAEWTDKRYYPGKIEAISNGLVHVLFDDGDKRSVQLFQIRLLPTRDAN